MSDLLESEDLHNCGNTTEAITLHLQKFIKKDSPQDMGKSQQQEWLYDTTKKNTGRNLNNYVVFCYSNRGVKGHLVLYFYL